MNGFVLLWSKILDSSIWKESESTRIVWFTLLAMKDDHGIVLAAPSGLAHRARVSQEKCDEAIRVLSSPDPESSSKAEDGRRIVEIPGGWSIVNHEAYRFSSEAKREFWRQQQAERRAAAALSRPSEKTEREPQPKFTPPTAEEMVAHGKIIGLPEDECLSAHSYYESNGWRVGKNPMKNWRAAIANWKRRNDGGRQKQKPVHRPEQNHIQENLPVPMLKI